jgi:hypothetical protein
LGEGPDQRVARITEPLPLRRVELREELSGMMLNTWRDAAAIIVNEIHHEKIGVGIVDMRNGEI